MNLFIFMLSAACLRFRDKYKHFVLTAKINMTFFLDKNIFLEILFL